MRAVSLYIIFSFCFKKTESTFKYNLKNILGHENRSATCKSLQPTNTLFNVSCQGSGSGCPFFLGRGLCLIARRLRSWRESRICRERKTGVLRKETWSQIEIDKSQPTCGAWYSTSGCRGGMGNWWPLRQSDSNTYKSTPFPRLPYIGQSISYYQYGHDLQTSRLTYKRVLVVIFFTLRTWDWLQYGFHDNLKAWQRTDTGTQDKVTLSKCLYLNGIQFLLFVA